MKITLNKGEVFDIIKAFLVEDMKFSAESLDLKQVLSYNEEDVYKTEFDGIEVSIENGKAKKETNVNSECRPSCGEPGFVTTTKP